MGVHHAWGRTYKDLYQRYKAMQGYEQRYQNGFDCQGLWVEVEVEKALGFNSKRDIESYGLDNFARACKERVHEYAARADRADHPPGPVDGLGRLVLHLHRHQHRVHLVLPQEVPRERLALSGHALDALVHALRHVAVAA